MVIKSSERHFNDEADGKRELVLVAVTYTGARSRWQDNAARTQGHWPSYGGFNQDVPEVAFLPDEGLGYFESHRDFEVSYAEEDIAAALLEKNFLAPEVFSVGAGGGESRQRVLDALGIERIPATEEGIREELTEVAALDEDPGDSAQVTLADELADPDDGHTRSELKAAADELRDGPDDISLQSGKTDFAEWLAGLTEGEDAMSETELKQAIAAANEGGDS